VSCKGDQGTIYLDLACSVLAQPFAIPTALTVSLQLRAPICIIIIVAVLIRLFQLTSTVTVFAPAPSGVIDSGLTVIPTEFLQSIKRALLISPIDGREVCCTTALLLSNCTTE
jgi:hypothetical protein